MPQARDNIIFDVFESLLLNIFLFRKQVRPMPPSTIPSKKTW